MKVMRKKNFNWMKWTVLDDTAKISEWQYRENGFPVTIIRLSHTYDERFVPLGVHEKIESWQVLKRLIVRESVIIHGDGTFGYVMEHYCPFGIADEAAKRGSLTDTYAVISIQNSHT